MKIIINGRFLTHRVTGVERYAHEICKALDKCSDENEYILAVPPEVSEIPYYNNIKIVKVGKLHDRLWEHVSFPRYVAKQKGISLNLCNVAPLSNPGIVCIHDVKIKARPQDFSKKFLLWYNILFNNETKRAKKIITVSEFSKKEIVKFYHLESEKVIVVPNAWQHFLATQFDENALHKYNLEKEHYYFSMCSLEPNKNFKWIARAAINNPNETFAVAGSINETVFANGLGFKCPENMKLLGYVSDEEAKTLMRDAKAFIFPTFYEGFGIPPLEALSSGCKKVIVSDTSVMHEIFEDAVVYIDPNDSSTFLNSKKQPNEDSYERILNKYSWEKSARILKFTVLDPLVQICTKRGEDAIR